MKLQVILHPEAGGGYSVAVPALPGCYSQGATLNEALANAREAAEGWLEAVDVEAAKWAADDRVEGIDL